MTATSTANLESGLMILPMSIGMVLASPFADLLSDKVNPHIVSIGGLVILTGTSLVLSGFQAITPGWIVLVNFFIAGVGADCFRLRLRMPRWTASIHLPRGLPVSRP